MKEKAVIIGAGSAMFTRGLAIDLIQHQWELELALVDIDPKALETADRLSRKMVEASRAPMKVSASLDRRDVLKGATAVITTIAVGGRRAWELDVQIPRKYEIYQPVGDSVMPGGSSRALRMIPPMVAIAADVVELAPDALFFNYANPMSVVCRAVRKETGAQVVGLCHGVFHVGHYLAELLGVPDSDLKYTAVGMNHLTWFTEIRVKGDDAKPRLREIAQQKLAALPGAAALGTRFPEAGTSDAASGVDPDEIQAFTWELFLLFDAFPAVLDRHVTEFFPYLFRGKRSYYGKTLGVERYSIEQVIQNGDRIYAQMQEEAFSPEPLGEDYFRRIGGEHEQVVDIIDSIRTDAARTYSANLPNRGQVPNLPYDCVVESPAIADASGMHPIALGPVPAGLAGSLATRFQWVETLVEAAVEGSRRKFIQALILDGAVDSVATATRLADDLLAAHAQYLPQFAR